MLPCDLRDFDKYRFAYKHCTQNQNEWHRSLLFKTKAETFHEMYNPFENISRFNNILGFHEKSLHYCNTLLKKYIVKLKSETITDKNPTVLCYKK
jgi:hypothetical protein